MHVMLLYKQFLYASICSSTLSSPLFPLDVIVYVCVCVCVCAHVSIQIVISMTSRDMHILQNFVYYIIGIPNVAFSAGDSYSVSIAEIAHIKNSESETQISNKTVWRIMLNRLLRYNIIVHVNA